jgi:hypothetical protein
MGSTLPVAIFFSGSPLKWSAKLSFQMVIKGKVKGEKCLILNV